MYNHFKNTIKLIAFDFDGTLFSTEHIILSVYEEAIHKHIQITGRNVKIPSQSQIMMQIGRPVKILFANLLPELPTEEQDQISNYVLELLCKKIMEGKGHVYDGVYETIEKLHSKFILCAASNGRFPYIDAILKYTQIEKFFTEICSLDYVQIKTKADLVRSYKEKYNLSGEQLLVVGDRDSDMEAAKLNGGFFCFAKYGHIVPNEVDFKTFEINHIHELSQYLL